MYHSLSETRHPLQPEEQEVGIDPLSSYSNKTGGDSNKNGRRSSTLDSDGTFNSYRKEWEELFVNNNYLATIRQKGINGQLRSSRFRSICWKLFLCVLPQDKSQWISRIKELRAWYSNIKEIHITNPRKVVGQQDLMINNPLSQDEGSLWNKFFQDKELRSMIEQDVKRTALCGANRRWKHWFPEMQFFQQENVRKILTDVLFCYARENEQLLYKQGMHELLAPIVFILHCDHQAFLHASESAQPSEEMKTLLNPEYLEHDAYAMFSQLMETAEPWFSTFEHDGQKGKETLMTPIPFARPQDLGPTIAIVTKVNQIQDHLLKKHDIELYMHLNRLEIAPQIYGLRWVRLLFGREFPLQDLLVVWDALFADGLSLSLVDYIFIAMLLYIRDALISSNYQTCLGLLMHYPLIGDVHSLILKALFLRDPKRNPRPVTYQFHPNLDYYKARGADLMNKSRTNAKGAPLNINKVSNSLINFGRKLISPAMTTPSSASGPVPAGGGGSSSTTVVSTRTLAEVPRHHLQQQQQQQQQRLMKSESMPVQLNKGDVVTGSDAQVSVPVQTLTDLQGQSSKTISSSPSTESLPGGREFTGSPPSSATKKDSFFSNISRSRSHSKTMGRKESEEELEAQISFLQGQLNDLDAMCKYCAKVMDTHLVNIQDVILQENLEKEDQILVSLAGLKQIKDILKGSLRFNQSQLEAEENEQITISDDHYCSSGQGQGQSDQMPRTTKQASSETPGHMDRGSADDFILVSKEDEGGSAKGSFSGQAQPLRTLRSTCGRSEPLARSPLVFSDPLMGPASASSSNPSSSPDEDSSSNSKDSGFTIVSPLDI
ncbi:TBC1 domain family member 5 isoform X1 [Canis lupus baileyi]|uniref:TBC1 domain family member 5 n=2 Tax=Canis lupus familiaris TaxID=9615 RepID=A0A8C0TLS1_CANLF|nr:TBC1 domain family member 5 isoform X1 [Canis lupus familiaris]XP_038288131.1 TBC1 domain family member 5 isoform X1 [Canis lupus familiaris]XP_038288132.1 TBC1 domain family member 5 isoform X1 [Canis lupus familiaris]XP_038288133.1 TBC1 domain family member 5 isoform X1 [Canis lupus familiaris]XP_038288134.1 TBC1 domain family member 5 isoform X1 [Canis lupus familiaris]XP_038288135.1 TBC1 domain family member 5 isoform X1 [Canis lupus familiaris]XP_038313301.1 TBC1 domain family member |eukprot:XP_022264296.1 TBC1 domain family member 5 isoform X1 [Canis lupus familiaris]